MLLQYNYVNQQSPTGSTVAGCENMAWNCRPMPIIHHLTSTLGQAEINVSGCHFQINSILMLSCYLSVDVTSYKNVLQSLNIDVLDVLKLIETIE